MIFYCFGAVHVNLFFSSYHHGDNILWLTTTAPIPTQFANQRDSHCQQSAHLRQPSTMRRDTTRDALPIQNKTSHGVSNTSKIVFTRQRMIVANKTTTPSHSFKEGCQVKLIASRLPQRDKRTTQQQPNRNHPRHWNRPIHTMIPIHTVAEKTKIEMRSTNMLKSKWQRKTYRESNFHPSKRQWKKNRCTRRRRRRRK